MKVLFLSTWYPNKISPKNGNFVRRHALSLSTCNQITVINVQVDPDLSPFKVEAAHYTDEDLNTYIYYIGNGYLSFIGKYIQIAIAYLKAYKEVIRKNDFDIIHANIIIHSGIAARIFSWFLRIPYVITEHSTAYTKERPPKNRFFYQLSKWATKNAAFILPVSQSLQADLTRIGISGNFHVIPNVVDSDIFYPANSFSFKKFRFLHISNFKPAAKNVEGILNAAKQLQEEGYDFELVIAGDGDKTPLIGYRNKLNLPESTVKILGPQSEEQVSELMRQSNCFVLFSNYENLPCVLLEAQSCGLPIIATDVGGVKEVVSSDDVGILISSKDERSLAEAMRSTLQANTSFDRFSIIEHAERYGKTAISISLNFVYHKSVRSFSNDNLTLHR